ncbi:MAG TPA: nitrilase family protein [Saprospiraceae bacterium]|nr:nitrilase family protein [Saprospiraceae bacterium]
MQDLIVTLIQKDLHWENPGQNLADIEALILNHHSDSDLIILPEMFSTGFSMHPESFAEKMDGPSVQWMQKLANQTNKTITGSLIIQEKENYYNRLLWVSPDQQIQTYDKRHLFSFANEDKHYTPGHELLETYLNEWKIRPLICYDLRFPIWSRNTTNYDVLIYVANWPEQRIDHWRSLLIARAIENQSFVIGVNRVGLDGHQIPHNGNSMIISPKGEILLEILDGEYIESFKLYRSKLDQYRAEFPALNDRE